MSSQHHSPDYYKILDVPRNAVDDIIREAYKKARFKYHPDKNPNNRAACEEKFKQVQEASEVLLDKSKRKIYDLGGKAALDQYEQEHSAGRQGPSPFQHPFARMFNQGGDGHSSSSRETPSMQAHLQCSLKEFYCGCTKTFKHTRRILCQKCVGKGGHVEPVACAACHGKGVRIVINRIGPGMVQQMQTGCQECRGKGRVMPLDQRCPTCTGSGLISTAEDIEVQFGPGKKPGDTLLFYGKADDGYQQETGNLIIILMDAQEDKELTRRGPKTLYNISGETEITLYDALFGKTYRWTHLNGTVLCMDTPADSIVNNGHVIFVPGYGMQRSDGSRADLYIKVNVRMPAQKDLASVTDAERQFLARICNVDTKTTTSSSAAEMDKHEEHVACDFVKSQKGVEIGNEQASSTSSEQGSSQQDESGYGGNHSEFQQQQCRQM